MKHILYTCSFISILFSSACSLPAVKAWERGDLASQSMDWTPDPVQAALREHIYSSKEGSSGGVKASGGGCGCY
ncbi:MAG: DUF4266 domain-containing protein [Pseudomonadales bacterium]|nr:DUF4266 domain-containing protein [Pseudomonadales bacterium]